MQIEFVVPGDLGTRTGGYGYDRRIVDGLRSSGDQVHVHRLHEGFPHPDRDALLAASRVFDGFADDALVVVDGLALGALPDLAARHGPRLGLVGLIHHPLAFESGLDPHLIQRLRYSEMEALRFCRRVITTSATTARTLADFDVDPARIDVVYPGTDPAPLNRGAGRPPWRLLCVATVTPRKGHRWLLDALAVHHKREWHLHCVGGLERDPREAADLRARIEALRLTDKVTLYGEVDDGLLHRLYDESDLFVLPSLMEGYGMAFAEALARGLPVIGSTAGAIPETVPPQAGLLVPPADIDALGRALGRWFDEPPLRQSMITGARRARDRLPRWEESVLRFRQVLAGCTLERTASR